MGFYLEECWKSRREKSRVYFGTNCIFRSQLENGPKTQRNSVDSGSGVVDLVGREVECWNGVRKCLAATLID
jgi:hypothetical protein